MVLSSRVEDDWLVAPFLRLRSIVKHEISQLVILIIEA